MTTSPTAFAAVPSVEKVGEAIVPKTSDLACDRKTQEPSEPCIPRGAQPDLDCAVCAYEEPPFGEPVQPAAHVLDPRTEARESCGLQIDVTELDRAGLRGPHKPVVLPFDTAITNRAFGVVPDGELRAHRQSSPTGARQSNARRLCDITDFSWPNAGGSRLSLLASARSQRDKGEPDAPHLSGRFLPATRMADRPGASVEAGAAGAGARSLADRTRQT